MNLDNHQLRELTHLRQWLHQHPELSGMEFQTINRIESFLTENCPQFNLTRVAETGLLCEVNNSAEGLSILMRADIDALPIDDSIQQNYASVYPGIGHKCGHDGHTSILCGLAMMLSNNPLNNVNISLLFQPSEENGEGAKKVLADKEFQKNHFDFVYALHNIPVEPLGKVLVKQGAFTPAVVSVNLSITGKTSHAAEPWNGINPAIAFSDILNLTESLENQDRNSENFTLVTLVYATLGSKDYGISPGNAELHFTIRCQSSEGLKNLISDFEQGINKICKEKGLNCKFDYFQEFASTENTQKATEIIKHSAELLNFICEELKVPFSWGENFGLYTQTFKGAMFGIGAGESCAPLHNTAYNYPDDLTPLASKMFYTIIQNSTVHV